MQLSYFKTYPVKPVLCLFNRDVTLLLSVCNETSPPQAAGYLEKQGNAPRGGVLNPVLRNKIFHFSFFSLHIGVKLKIIINSKRK